MGKYDSRENRRPAGRSTAKSMRSRMIRSDRKLVSFNVNPEVYAEFAWLNDRRGLSNTAVLNLLIESYIKEQNGEDQSEDVM